MRALGRTGLEVFELCLGGNVFGWTADRDASFAILDAYADAGGNFIDTANSYSAFAEGNSGGESEAIIGEWCEKRGNRDEMVIATKVGGRMPGQHGLTAEIVRQACDDSLRRLRTDRIDVYYAHFDHPETPLEETFGAFAALVDAGKARHVALSNYEPERVRAVLELADVSVIQPLYNLVERGYEGGLRPVAEEHGLACVPYYGLASGFLAGKYRPGGGEIDSRRAGSAARYLDSPAGPRVLEALDEVAGAHGVPVAAVALAWLAAQPTVAAPIASARTVEQLAELLPMAQLELSEGELRRLTDASD